jgi:hypothetical protein
MPIQEILTGVTFPGSGLVNVNTLKNPLQYFGSLLHLWSKADSGATLSPGISEAITTSSISGNVGTVGMSLANVSSAYKIGQSVTIAGCTNAPAINGSRIITALTTSTMSFAVNSANVTSAAESSATVVASQISDWLDNSSYGHNFNVIGDASWPGPAECSYTSALNAAITLPTVTPVSINGPHAGFLKQTYSSDFDFAATTPFSVVMAVIPGATPGNVYPTDIGNIAGSAGSGGWSLSTWQTSAIKQPTFRLVNTRGTAECSVSTNATITPGTPVIIHAVNAGTGTAAGLSIYLNGVLQATTTLFDNLAGATTITGNAIALPGASSSGGGTSSATFLETFIVNKAMTATDVALMDGYLNAKWAIHT